MENTIDTNRLKYQAPELVVLDTSESTMAGGHGINEDFSGFFS